MSGFRYQVFAPGKVILLGEHSVVYGFPALAAPLALGVTATVRSAQACRLVVQGPRQIQAAFSRAAAAAGRPRVEIRVRSELPISMGLGSSAALSVACARALLGPSPASRDVIRIALEMERGFHGTPSGIDHTCSAMGRLIRFQKGRARPLKAGRPLKLVVALVGPRRSTRETVAALRARASVWPSRYRRIFAEIGRLAEDGTTAISQGDAASLGDLMNLNQGLLTALGLSSPAIDGMVHRLRALGALGAKLTGAGGDGGAVIGLFARTDAVLARLSRAGVRCFGTEIA